MRGGIGRSTLAVLHCTVGVGVCVCVHVAVRYVLGKKSKTLVPRNCRLLIVRRLAPKVPHGMPSHMRTKQLSCGLQKSKMNMSWLNGDS
jgi:hypothetical protein